MAVSLQAMFNEAVYNEAVYNEAVYNEAVYNEVVFVERDEHKVVFDVRKTVARSVEG